SSLATLSGSSSICSSDHSGEPCSTQHSLLSLPALLLSLAIQESGELWTKAPSNGSSTGALKASRTAQHPNILTLAALSASLCALERSRFACGAGVAATTIS